MSLKTVKDSKNYNKLIEIINNCFDILIKDLIKKENINTQPILEERKGNNSIKKINSMSLKKEYDLETYNILIQLINDCLRILL
jgi:hypothetical protein